MRKVKLYIATSLDGKIARKDHSLDWLPEINGEDYGYQELYNSIDTTLMGYKTYEVCLSLGEWAYREKKNFVFTRNACKTTIPEANLITQDPVTFVQQLKEEPGQDIWLIGGGEIITLLHDADLIDEYIIAYIPVVLGEGIELFPQVKRQQNLTLIRNQVYANGVVLLHFVR